MIRDFLQDLEIIFRNCLLEIILISVIVNRIKLEKKL